MKSELLILIEELQKEQDYLEHEINLCIKEWDYLGAEAFKKPLIYTRNKLRILRNLENPNFNRISFLKAKIERLSELEVKDKNWYLRRSLDQMKSKIPEYEDELLELSKEKGKAHSDSENIVICIENLWSKKIDQFEIEFEHEKNITIQFYRSNDNLIVELNKRDKEHSLNYFIAKDGIVELKKIGFKISDMNAMLSIEKNQKSSIHSLLEVLSRVIFDVLRQYGDKKAIITIENKSSS